MKIEEIERSIIKKYRKTIWKNFIKGINEFELIKENDIIAVCISGGKDSFLLAKCLEEVKKHGKLHFELKYICMDPGYSKEHLKKIKENAQILEIPLEIFKTDVFAVSNKLNEKHPCYLCARMRRGYLYDYAQKIGCNKIALAHHFDDVIETTLLSLFYSGDFKTMMPKLKSDNFQNMELIRPLYFVREKDIISWTKTNNLQFLNCACKFVETKKESKREEIKKLLEMLRINNPFLDKNIYKSTENVNLNTIISYKKDNIVRHFLEDYDK